MLFQMAPLEGVMNEDFVRAADSLDLFDDWVTPFFRFSEGMPRVKRLKEFAAPFLESGKPVTVQLMGTDPALLAAGAAAFVELGAAAVDLNFGCPSRQVTSGGAGGGALKTPDLLRRIVNEVKTALPATPLSVKIRTGWQSDAELPAIIEALTADGATARVVVHFRTVAEQYRPVLGRVERWARAIELIAGRAETVINGDLATAAELRELPPKLGAVGAMAGRGVLRDPYLLRRAKGKAAPELAEGKHLFFAAAVAAAGEMAAGRAIELSNFIWGRENPYFEFLKKVKIFTTRDLVIQS